MKNKFSRLAFLVLIVGIILSFIVNRILYVQNSLIEHTDKAGDSFKTVYVQLKYNDNSLSDSLPVSINAPIIQTQDSELTIEGIDLVKNAAKHLGRKYDSTEGGVGAWEQPNEKDGGSIDCSGLVMCALQDAGISISGLCMRTLTVPRAVQNWLQYGEASNGSSGSAPEKFFSEVGTYYLDTKSTDNREDDTIEFDPSNSNGESVYDRASSVTFTKDGVTNKVNVLKVNDPIGVDDDGNKYRWYNYYDADGKIKTLPAGTIVCSFAAGKNYSVGSNHMWMAIGDLGTTDANVAVTKLKEMGILPDNYDNSNGLIYSENDHSTYWMIESSPKTISGVQISNYDPNQNESSGSNNKATGTIWAYQVARDEQEEPGKFSMDIKKIDRATGAALPGATFHFEDKNTNTVDDNKVTGENGVVQLVGETTFNEEKTFSYAVSEKTPPSGYGSDVNRLFNINVNTQKSGKQYQVKDVTISGEQIPEQTIALGKTYQYLTDGTWKEGSERDSAKTLFMITVGENASNLNLSLTWANPETKGSFDVNLVKKSTQGEGLDGAIFSIKVAKIENEQVTDDVIYTGVNPTSNGGNLSFSGINIKGAGEKYQVTLEETTPPAGYIGIDGPISFPVTTELDEATNTYRLHPDGIIRVENAKEVNVKENEILIEAENRTTTIDIHKGVKTVENQDSGYYYADTEAKMVIHDESENNEQTEENSENASEENNGESEGESTEDTSEEEKKYKDERTSEEYTEIELEDIYHEWVVETTIPEGVEEYLEYAVTDPIDTTKLDFSGLHRVKVELIDSTGKVKSTLKEGKENDYLADYDEESDTLTVTYIDKNDGNSFYGKFLSGVTTSDKIRLTFNTTFKVNPETGKLVVLENAVTNAENQATLNYDNGSGPRTKKSEVPEVHTGAVSVFKYEDTNGNGKHDEGEKALVGAEFKIALSEADAKAGKFLKIDGKELTAVSNKDGIATFVGLSFGGDAMDSNELTSDELTGAPVYEYDWEKASKDYYIVETKTPAGYEKLTDVLKVTVSKNSSEIIDLTDKINEMDSVGNKPLKFDLALRKWVTTAYVTENGQTVEYKTGHKAEDDPEDVVKVDLKKSKINDVTVKFKYSIRITNEGEIAGEAREITDYIPAGLKFVKEDNPDWVATSDERVVKTRKLEGVTLQPKESAEVEIMLTWVNGENTMGVMTNTAEISEDYNEYGVHDIDSTPDNKKSGEDDIDIAQVMLTIKTGSEIIAYSSLGLGFVMIITGGVIMVRRKFVNM